ncbi:glycosyltransferase family 4 protein [Empedobacter sp. GD03865]|uniref:glycosyltransferase family 4 protein n=1 Tax=Empedobacter sp. GD03865 TaxID=2975392 RepID=UPI00244A4A42|nr:glycosyltransferase family 4 protein [Empedobacter sp. GD03865]MDH0659108.1 glycosyltransferase family 4 protein [Empedobacter sp. GD03865]
MILHITNDYSGSTVYKNLVGELDNLNLGQIVYNPIREASRIGKNKIDFKNKKSKIFYSKILNKYTDRILYKKKINKIVKDIESKVDLTKITYIHAHTWYSDGGAAYILSQKYNIPYIVAIRNTDLNLFFKYFIHERNFGKRILKNAQKIITISEVYKKRVLESDKLTSLKSSLLDKVMVIPNGVDSFWIENNTSNKNNTISNDVNALYIGKFDKGKNVLNLVKAVKNINHKGKHKVHLTLVGGGGSDHLQILENIKECNLISFTGKITDKRKLLDIYRSNQLFTMPSKAETFGLVYVEAMLQCLPILYTSNEGIDGFYEENIGEKIESLDEIEIENKILKLITCFSAYHIPTEKLIVNHDWKLIAKKYKELYNA